MIQLLKREFYLNRIYFLLVLLTFPLIHGAVYPLLVFISILGFSMYQSFYVEFKYHVNHSLVSMPIKKEHIVLARYLFLLAAVILSLFYLLFFEHFAGIGLPAIDYGKITGLYFFLMAIVFGFVLSIFIPFFYYFKSFQKVFFMHSLIISIGLLCFTFFVRIPVLFHTPIIQKTLNNIAIQSFIIPIMFVLVCLYFSYKLSVYFFLSRDIT